MALKLVVPWLPEPLPVGYEGVTAELEEYLPSPYLEEVGDDLRVTNFFGDNNKVPDVSRYRIDNLPEHHHIRHRLFCDRCIIPHCDVSGAALAEQLQQPDFRSIVLLLESPHKNEYQPGYVDCPIAPANGETGHNIDRCLGTVLTRIGLQNLILTGCHVIISNPIQFQTSLHAIHGNSPQHDVWGKLRDKVWKALWEEGTEGGRLGYIQLCFRARLNTYNPSLIINACTGAYNGNKGNDLKRLVNKFLYEEYPTIPLYKTNHPSCTSWNDCAGMPLDRINPPANQNAGNQQQ